MNLGIEGKRALVTGGSKGIGLAIVDALRAEGCEVTSLSRATGFDALQPWTYPDAADYDILINNVGGGGRWGSAFVDTPEKIWQEVMAKNLWAALRFTRLCLPGMLARSWGRVVTIGSIYGKEAGGRPWFTVAKAAEIALMKSLAIQPRPGITFNSVCPGPIDVSPEQDGLDPKPQVVAPLVAFLCSQQAAHISGACITCDGGESRSF